MAALKITIDQRSRNKSNTVEMKEQKRCEGCRAGARHFRKGTLRALHPFLIRWNASDKAHSLFCWPDSDKNTVVCINSDLGYAHSALKLLFEFFFIYISIYAVPNFSLSSRPSSSATFPFRAMPGLLSAPVK